MTLKKLLIILLVCTLFTSCFNGEKEESRLQYIEIINEGMIPIAKIDIKGKVYTFLLDSGSPISLLDRKLIENGNLIIMKEKAMKESMYGFEAKDYVVIMDTRFYLHDFKSTQEKIFYHTGERIDGVLGGDFLIRNKSIVDFDKAILKNLKHAK